MLSFYQKVRVLEEQLGVSKKTYQCCHSLNEDYQEIPCFKSNKDEKFKEFCSTLHYIYKRYYSSEKEPSIVIEHNDKEKPAIFNEIQKLWCEKYHHVNGEKIPSTYDMTQDFRYRKYFINDD